MSITKAKYEANDGDVFTIYLGAATLEANGGSATGTLTNPSVVVEASNRGNRRGLSPRRINLRRALGTVGTGAAARTVYQYASLVVCTAATYATLLSQNTVTYKGSAWEVASGTAES